MKLRSLVFLFFCVVVAVTPASAQQRRSVPSHGLTMPQPLPPSLGGGSYDRLPDVRAVPETQNAYPDTPQASPPFVRGVPLPPCHPYDCDTLQRIEEARRNYIECDRTARDEDEFEDCVFGWLSPNDFRNFLACYRANERSGIDCFVDALLIGPNVVR